MKVSCVVGLLLLVATTIHGSNVGAPVGRYKKKQFLREIGASMLLPEIALRVVGGNPAPAGRYPYMARMFYGFFPLPQCGGTLIAPNVPSVNLAHFQRLSCVGTVVLPKDNSSC